MVREGDTPFPCDHDMEDTTIDALGPPSLGIRKPDGSADILDADSEGRDIRTKAQIPGSKCRKCGWEVPKNRPSRASRVVFECRIEMSRPCRVVAIPYQTSDKIQRYDVEILIRHAAMGEPVWEKVDKVGQLLAVIAALIEETKPKWETSVKSTCGTTRLCPPHGDALDGANCGRSPVVGVVVTDLSALLVCERCAVHWREDSGMHVEPVAVRPVHRLATARPGVADAE